MYTGALAYCINECRRVRLNKYLLDFSSDFHVIRYCLGFEFFKDVTASECFNCQISSLPCYVYAEQQIPDVFSIIRFPPISCCLCPGQRNQLSLSLFGEFTKNFDSEKIVWPIPFTFPFKVI